MTHRILHWISRLILSGIFIYSGYVKLQAPLQFAGAIAGYQLVPERFIFPLATYLPWFEIALGILLLSGWKLRYVSASASGLLLMFTVVLAVTYFRGIEAECGCFGFGDRISLFTIARDSVFLIPALFLTFESRVRTRSTVHA